MSKVVYISKLESSNYMQLFIYIFYKHTIQVSLSIFYSYNNDDNNNDNKKLDQNGKVHDY